MCQPPPAAKPCADLARAAASATAAEMQVSDSLANFMTRLDSGASGVDDALAAVQACADDHAGILDLQQMSLTDEDLPAIIAKLGPLASHVKTLNLFLNEYV